MESEIIAELGSQRSFDWRQGKRVDDPAARRDCATAYIRYLEVTAYQPALEKGSPRRSMICRAVHVPSFCLNSYPE